MSDIEHVRNMLIWHADHAQDEWDEALSAFDRIVNALHDADSAVSWCVARHPADDATREANAAIQSLTRVRG